MWQTASDFFIFLGWLWQNITLILKDVFLPIQYIYTFLRSFFNNAFGQPIVPENIWTFDDNVLAVFDAIPHFSTLIYVAVLGIMILMIVFLLKTFLRT